jgi:hypothetical protein
MKKAEVAGSLAAAHRLAQGLAVPFGEVFVADVEDVARVAAVDVVFAAEQVALSLSRPDCSAERYSGIP